MFIVRFGFEQFKKHWWKRAIRRQQSMPDRVVSARTPSSKLATMV
jgi:hypothetical protein